MNRNLMDMLIAYCGNGINADEGALRAFEDMDGSVVVKLELDDRSELAQRFTYESVSEVLHI